MNIDFTNPRQLLDGYDYCCGKAHEGLISLINKYPLAGRACLVSALTLELVFLEVVSIVSIVEPLFKWFGSLFTNSKQTWSQMAKDTAYILSKTVQQTLILPFYWLIQVLIVFPYYPQTLMNRAVLHHVLY